MNVLTQASLLFELRTKSGFIRMNHIEVPEELLSPVTMVSGKGSIAVNCNTIVERIIALEEYIDQFKSNQQTH